MKSRPLQKITLIIDGFGQGGIQQTYKVLIREYTQTFDEVYLVIIEAEESDLVFESFNNFHIVKFCAKSLIDIPNFIKFWKIIKKIDSNIIISNMYRSHVWSSIARNQTAKLIWVEQNTYTKRTPLQWKLLKILSRRVDKIVGISDEVSTLTGDRLNRVLETIPNPITFTKIGNVSKSRSDDFIFVGRMTHQKNPELLLRSFHSFLTNFNSDSKLHLVGGGILLESIRTLSRNLNIENSCIFHEWKELDDIHNLMASVKTLVSTSIVEGMGIVRLEALASGCCVVTTKTGGTHLFQHLNQAGFFACEDTVQSLSNAMNESLNGSYWTQESINVRSQTIELFNPKKISQKLIE